MCAVSIATKQDMAWDCLRNEDRDKMVSIFSPDNLWMRYCWSSESMPMRRHAPILAALGHCQCGTLLCLEEEEHQSDHNKQWNVQVSWNRDSKGPHRHWKFHWHWSASSTWEAIRFLPVAGLWCYQSLGWCSNHTDGNGKVLQRGSHVCSTQVWPTWLLASSLNSNRRCGPLHVNVQETGNWPSYKTVSLNTMHPAK